MHIGLIGGMGPAATDYYYRGLIRTMAAPICSWHSTVKSAAFLLLIALPGILQPWRKLRQLKR